MNDEDLQENERIQYYHIDCPVLVTDRLVLRLPHIEDIDAIADLANNKRVSAMLAKMPYPFLRGQAVEFVKRACEGNMGYCVYAITLGETGAFIGCCGVQDRDDNQGTEIICWLGEPYWGQGYGTEAVNALIDVAFRATNIDELYVSCLKSNTAGRRVLQKSGFHCFKTTDELRDMPGAVVEHYMLDRVHWISLRSLQPGAARI